MPRKRLTGLLDPLNPKARGRSHSLRALRIKIRAELVERTMAARADLARGEAMLPPSGAPSSEEIAAMLAKKLRRP